MTIQFAKPYVRPSQIHCHCTFGPNKTVNLRPLCPFCFQVCFKQQATDVHDFLWRMDDQHFPTLSKHYIQKINPTLHTQSSHLDTHCTCPNKRDGSHSWWDAWRQHHPRRPQNHPFANKKQLIFTETKTPWILVGKVFLLGRNLRTFTKWQDVLYLWYGLCRPKLHRSKPDFLNFAPMRFRTCENPTVRLDQHPAQVKSHL